LLLLARATVFGLIAVPQPTVMFVRKRFLASLLCHSRVDLFVQDVLYLQIAACSLLNVAASQFADLENRYRFLMGKVGVGLECSFSY